MADAIKSFPEFDELELIKTGNTSITSLADTSLTNVTVPHNLGFFPMSLAYVEIGDESQLIPAITVMDMDAGNNLEIKEFLEYYLTEQNIVFYISSIPGGNTYNIVYYLFRVRGAG